MLATAPRPHLLGLASPSHSCPAHSDHDVFPCVTPVYTSACCTQDAMRILPGSTLPELLRQNPELITSLVKGKSLIPYDQVSNPWS